jgi:hypothetical protein
MKNLFEIGQSVIFSSGGNAPITTQVLGFKYSETSKIYLYRLEARPGVFFSESCLSQVPAKLKNEDIYSMDRIDRMLEEEHQMLMDRHYR